LDTTDDLSNSEKLQSILKRVKGMDLNPLAVLSSRINYFINISPLIEDGVAFEIPVYLGDASYVPQRIKVDDISCLEYKIATLKGDLEIIIPVSATSDPLLFSQAMTMIEVHISNLDEDAVSQELFNIIDDNDKKDNVIKNIEHLSQSLVDLERNDWNGIWARIITNFLTTANMGKFDLVVGNPPWIDWKNLPINYRERIKGLCLDRSLFSGDSVTGGINLNICALIANVASENWLSKDGILGFLMPKPLLFQQSYEGFRLLALKNKQRLYFQQFVDWTASGHPFKPVQQQFLTFYIGRNKMDYAQGIPVLGYIKKKKTNRGCTVKSLNHFSGETSFENVDRLFKRLSQRAFTTSESTAFTYASGKRQLSQFKRIAGESLYKGREGVEFYPQEFFLLEIIKIMPNNRVMVKNYQGGKSKYKIAQQSRILEIKFLHPLVKGVDIERFHIKESSFYVPFPYAIDHNDGRAPIAKKILTKTSPNLMKYINENKGVFQEQTTYNDKIIGKKHNTEFYSIARVGKYSHADCFVAFRDNTKWQAAVVENITAPWGESKRPVFQNHAVTISERPDGTYISVDEAHFICAILNTPIVAQYFIQSSDSRSFKIRPPIKIPLYKPTNITHNKLRDLSMKAHKEWNNPLKIEEIDKELNKLYLIIAGRLK